MNAWSQMKSRDAANPLVPLSVWAKADKGSSLSRPQQSVTRSSTPKRERGASFFLPSIPRPIHHNGRPRDTSIRHAFSRYPNHPYPKSRRLVRRWKRCDPDGEHRLQSIPWHSSLEFDRLCRYVFRAPADQRDRSGCVRLLPPYPDIRYPGGHQALSQGHSRCRVSLSHPRT